MSRDEDEDERAYTVVVNHEEQYSIWLAGREIPKGWREVGKTGKKAECLAHIKEVWTDMRPLSLRKWMAEHAENALAAEVEPPAQKRHPQGKNELVERLEEPQPIELAARPEPTLQSLRQQIANDRVFVKFPRTGTELGIRIDKSASDVAGANLDKGTGTIRIVGDLVLNYNKVRCRGEISLETLKGTGRLEFVSEVKPGDAAP